MGRTLKIANKEIEALNVCNSCAFPKYATQIMNLANNNARDPPEGGWPDE
jgi:hypothetical protein